jgi:alginate O-acetyltransferase complex protein AlgJ
MSKKDASLAPVPASAMTIRLSPLAGIVMALFLGCGLLACLWAMLVSHSVDWLPKQVTWQVLRDGDITHHIAKELSHVELARKAADLERAGSWLLLGDTGPRVRQGCHGWLFLADENRIHPHALSNAQDRANKVVAVRDWLAQRKIALQVVVVPDKSRIAAQQLCTLLRPSQLQERTVQWRAILREYGVAVLDLTATLTPLGSHAFLRSDSHWSEQGAQAAAQVLAGQIHVRGVQASPRQSLQRSLLPEALRPGDLVRLAGLDWLPQCLQPAADYVQATRFSATVQTQAASEDDLFGDSQLPNVALIGTSFSRNSNFVPFLEQALGASIGNFAKDGGEFSGAAKDYFASPAFQQTPPQLLIWEIPERDLQAAFSDDLPLAPR